MMTDSAEGKKKEYRIEITAEMEGDRIDRVLAGAVDTVSRSFFQRMLKNGEVLVNQSAVKASFQVKDGDEVVFLIPEAVEPDIEAQDIPLSILYEDDDVLVVDKPKGMVVHPAAGHYRDTLVNAVMYHCKGKLSGINGVLRPGIVHRIDKDTTGSLLVCKNDLAHQSIAAQLKEHSINRRYHAIVFGTFREAEGTIDAPIARDPKERKRMAVVEGGKPAVTHYKVLRQFQDFAYVECVLETGRTHQIRVHMSHIGHPLLGDELYCNRSSKYKTDGQCLHAMTLGFVQPSTGQYIEVNAPLPAYFQHLLDIL